MRVYILLASTSLLAACGGGGATSISSAPGPIQSPSGSTSTATHTFVNPTQPKTYTGVGAVQTYEYLTDERLCCNQQAEKYAGSASTVRNSGISISYDPRDAVFTLVVNDPLANTQASTRFQDPASRTDFGGAHEPQWGTPKLTNSNIGYLQSGDGNPLSPYSYSGSGLVNPGNNTTPPRGETGSSYQATSLFYLKPGTETKYVTFAGYARNTLGFSQQTVNNAAGVPTPVDVVTYHLERGAFAYGELTDNNAVPTTGTGSYRGSMLASMIFNPTLDGQDVGGSTILPSYFQWIEGTAALNVDFLSKAFQLALTGTVLAPQIDDNTSPTSTVVAAGAAFAAAGKGTISLVNFGGFRGAFDSTSLTNPNGGLRRDVAVEGSSIDGAFYGPNGEEAGGGFRIVGGKPDERVDIVGAFVGKK